MTRKREKRGLGILAAVLCLLVATAPLTSAHDNADDNWITNVNGSYDWWILYKYNTTFPFPSQSYRDRFASGGFQWNNVGRDFVFVNSQATSSPDIDVRYQVLSFPYDSSALAVESNSKLFGGDIYFADLRINASYTWYTGTGSPPGGQYDLWAVATHELGHAVALNHSSASADTMYQYYQGTDWRSLTAHDMDGITWFYPAH